jgi:hypothetical protein
MNIEQAILEKIRQLPPAQQQEVLDFSTFLQQKNSLPTPDEALQSNTISVQASTNKRKPVFGSDRDIISISDDFDEPLEDFEEYM